MDQLTPRISTCILFVLLLTPARSQGATENLNPSQDNTLYEDTNGTLSNGVGQGLFSGKTRNGDLRRALLQFDIAAGLPASATITSVTLALNMTKAASPAPEAMTLRRITASWGEGGSLASGAGGNGSVAQPGDATWKHRFSPSTNWNTLGGDFSSDASAVVNVGGLGTYRWTSTEMIADVQDMLDSPDGNFGWLLFGNEDSSQTAKRFGARESSSPPVLTIAFDLPVVSPADFDGDGSVDGSDLATWSSAFGANTNGDTDEDNDTDGADFLVWQREHTGPGTLQAAAIPEPTSTSLALWFLSFVALNRPRKASLFWFQQK